jgi:glutamine amidotransferase
MCRLLAVQSNEAISVGCHLRDFAAIAKNSKEYQGHGWGCAYRVRDGFRVHKDIRPIWESELPSLPPTTMLIAHARSAFRDEGIAVENNMPFTDDDEKTVFAFNGELRGVRIREEGRIGAEKVFRFAKRFEELGWEKALLKATAIIEKRSEYVRALNVVLSDGVRVYASSRFNEDPEYFTMYYRRGADGAAVVCSEPLPMFPRREWSPIANGEVRTFP